MPLRVTCKGCAAEYSVPESFAGRSVRCKRCGVSFDIPPIAGAKLDGGETVPGDAPDVAFKDEGDKVFKAPPTPTVKPKVGQFKRAEEHDELDVAGATKPVVKEEQTNAVGRPDADGGPTGKKRLLKLRPGAKSFHEKAKKGELAVLATQKKEEEELRSRIEMRIVISDFRRNPLAKVILIGGLGAFIAYYLWMAAHHSDWLVLRNLGVGLLIYSAIMLPFGAAGVVLACLAFRFKYTRPLAFIVGVTAATPPGILAIGMLTEDDSWKLIMAVAAIPFTFWVFHIAFQQGILRNLAAFFGMLLVPLLAAWLAFSYVQSDAGLRDSFDEYAKPLPASHAARMAAKNNPNPNPAPTTIPDTQPANP